MSVILLELADVRLVLEGELTSAQHQAVSVTWAGAAHFLEPLVLEVLGVALHGARRSSWRPRALD